MTVEFGLNLPARRPEQVDFDASPVSAPLLTGEERRHRELLSALQQLGQAVTDIDVPASEVVAGAVPVAQDPFLLASAVRDALSPLVEAQNALTAEALSGVLDRLKVLSKQVVAFASGGSGSGSASGHVIVDSGTINLGTAVTLDSTAINTISEALTDTELRATPVPVSGTVTTGGLTDAQLRATAVPVSGTVTATGPLTDTQLRATAVPVSGTVALDATAVSAIQEALTNTELRATPVPVSGTVSTGGLTNTELRATPVPVSGTVTPSETRTLTQRMYEKSPQSGYHLWLDVTSTDATRIFIAEAPDGSAQSATVFQGIRVTLDASGNPLGATETATAFAWSSRSSATWVS